MINLVWQDSFATGIDFIDADHRKLFETMQDIRQAIEGNNFDACETLLTTFLEEANKHFSREEKLLLDTNYPELEEHKVCHKRLLIKAATTRNICGRIEAERVLKEYFNGMADFLIDDVLREDIKFKVYLENEGHIKNT